MPLELQNILNGQHLHVLYLIIHMPAYRKVVHMHSLQEYMCKVFYCCGSHLLVWISLLALKSVRVELLRALQLANT